jgi:hypothetical protein
MEGRQLFQEYFNMEITTDGKVNSIPRLLRQYTPDLDRLPLFLMRIGPQVRSHIFQLMYTGASTDLLYRSTGAMRPNVSAHSCGSSRTSTFPGPYHSKL